jgi:hypothetical protein
MTKLLNHPQHSQESFKWFRSLHQETSSLIILPHTKSLLSPSFKKRISFCSSKKGERWGKNNDNKCGKRQKKQA